MDEVKLFPGVRQIRFPTYVYGWSETVVAFPLLSGNATAYGRWLATATT